MASDVSQSIGEFQSVSELLFSDVSLQAAMGVLVIGVIVIVLAYRKFSKWTFSKTFSYTRPHVARFIRTALLPIFALILITGINGYVQATGLFAESNDIEGSPRDIFSKILNSLNVVVIGYTVSQLIPVIIKKHQKSKEEWEDFVVWREKRGFPDDEPGFFHRLYEWAPPRDPPENMDA